LQTPLWILKIAERRVRQLDRLQVERVSIGRRGIERTYDAGIMTGERIVNQNRKQAGVGRRLRADNDRQRRQLPGVAVSNASNNRSVARGLARVRRRSSAKDGTKQLHCPGKGTLWSRQYDMLGLSP
jgi:hypothetical protein